MILAEEKVFNRFEQFSKFVDLAEKMNPKYKNREELYENSERLFTLKYEARAYASYDSYRSQKKYRQSIKR